MGRIADSATNRVADYINALGFKVSVISRKTGIPDGMLYKSISDRERSLRADEFLRICVFLKKDPSDFAQDISQTSA